MDGTIHGDKFEKSLKSIIVFKIGCADL